MKKYLVIYKSNGGETIDTRECSAATKQGAKKIANQMAAALALGRSSEVTYEMAELPNVGANGEMTAPDKQRRTRSSGGVRQTPFTLRLDNDLLEPLSQISNKGRLINDLLHDFFAAKNTPHAEEQPDEPDSKEQWRA